MTTTATGRTTAGKSRTAKSAGRTTSASTAKPTAKPAAKPAAKPTAKPAAKAAPKQAPKQASRQASKQAPKQTAKPAPKSAAKSAAKSAGKPTAKKAATKTVVRAKGARSTAPDLTPAPEVVAAPEPRGRRRPVIGHVALVSAGPGDPELLTLRAAALIAAADVIVADADAVEVARAHALPTTRIVIAVDGAGMPLDHAGRSSLVVDAAKEGLATVRLISGDPVIDGSLLHEVSALRKARIDFEVAPGVSEVTGVPAYAGFALTGGRTRQVRIVDAHDNDLPWAELAAPRVTVVFVNGADRAIDIAGRLLAAGANPATQIAVTRRGTTVDQRTVAAALSDFAAVARAARQAGPGLVVVGEVVAQRERLDWFEVKALFGWRVLIPRTQDHAGPIVSLLRAHGAVPVEVPTISVEPPRTPQQIDRAVHGLVSGRFEWIGFTSVNAVRAIREKLEEYGLDARSFAGLKVAAVGEPTVASLVEFGVRPDIVPNGEQTTSALLDEWPAYDSLTDPINRVFLPRADIATDTLAAGLGELGWEVEDVTAYRTVRAAPPPAETREAIKTGGFDAVLFTSSSTVRNLVGIAGKPHHSTVVACIGPQTAKAAEEHGLRVDVLAETSTIGGLVDALAAHGESLRAAALEAGEGTWRPSRRRTTARRKAT